MIGDAEVLVVATDDDTLHEPTSPHPWWTETFWLSFGIPERRMQVCVYPWFRPNIGMQAGGVIVWDGSGVLPWDLAFCDYGFHVVMPDDLDLRDARLPNGLELRCLEPQQAYSVKYAHEDLTIDITFRGIMDPMVAGKDGRPNHIDQPGFVTGTIVLRGDEIAVDAAAIRDRGWAVRLDTPRVGLASGTCAGSPRCRSWRSRCPAADDEPVIDAGTSLPTVRPYASGRGSVDGACRRRPEERPDRCHRRARPAARGRGNVREPDGILCVSRNPGLGLRGQWVDSRKRGLGRGPGRVAVS